MSSTRIVAIDSGAGHVACGVFSAQNGKLTLEKFSLESFNPDSALENQWVDLVSGSVASAQKLGRHTGEAVLGLPGHHTLTKFVKTPAVDKSKRAKIIEFEAQQNIPYSLDEVVWDSLSVADDGVDLEVMLAAVKIEVVDPLCSSLKKAGCGISSVSPSTLALYRSFKYNYPDTADCVLIVNIGARSTNLLFVDKGKFFVRTIPLAGNSVTQAISEEIKQDFSHSEALKLQVLSGKSDLPESSPSRAAVANASSSFVGRLQLEITRSTVNYRRQSGAEQPVCVYVTGGGSLIPELVEALGEKLKLRVERLDPLKNVTVGSGSIDAESRKAVLADFVGLATRLVDQGEPRFNLLPPAIIEDIAFRKQQPLYLLAAALGVAALGIPIFHYNQKAVVANAEVRSLDRELAPKNALKADNEAMIAKIESLKKEISAIQGLAESKANWITFFTDLQERLVKVEDVWLEKVQVVRPGTETPVPQPEVTGSEAPSAPAPVVIKLNLSGRLLDKANPVSKVSQESYARVKTLLASFAGSQFVSNVESERFDPTQPGILRFDFVLVVNPKKPL